MTLFKKNARAIFWNNNPKAIQRMLDYDFICGRETPSVGAIVHPSGSVSLQKFFMGSEEIPIPVYRSTKEACRMHPECSVFLNFASFRSAYDITMEALDIPSLQTFMITAEGIPERFAVNMARKAFRNNKIVIGPATVGAIVPGSFKTGNICGTLSNITRSKLHRPGSAGVITKSGGLFNELANILSTYGDGMAEGMAIGGDRFPGSSYKEHLLRMENNPRIRYIVVLGEVGGTAEYEIVDLLKQGLIKKPILALCIGTVAEFFGREIQFGHAGASAGKDSETADAKNQALRSAGAIVPETFNELPLLIEKTYRELFSRGVIPVIPEPRVPTVPEDYLRAKSAGKVRRATSFVCTISDDRGEEAVYAGHPISSVAGPDTGFSLTDVLSLLWFKRRFPKWAADFMETVLKTVADHGPAVSGAHNARVTARAGKDLISSLVSGLLTIGPKFGGAIDEAAKYFKKASEEKLSPAAFVREMKTKNIPIPGIGHLIKSITNPDLRVSCLKEYAYRHFPHTSLLEYALEVERITTAKKESLILNVDGTIGVLMVDMWRGLKYSEEEIDRFIDMGVLNGFFVLGRSIGFMGHIFDEKRLNMPLYRHDTDDILYKVSEEERD